MRLLRVGVPAVAAATLTACGLRDGLRDGGGTQRQAPARDTAARVVTEKDFDHRNVVVIVSDLVKMDHRQQGARAGPAMLANSTPGPTYSQGWGPAVDYTDRGRVYKLGQETCVAAGCYKDVLVTDEFALDEPEARQLKYYAPGVGNVRVDWMERDEEKEVLSWSV
jgi:hypothetical protein